MSPTLALAKELLRRPSVTPEDGGCQDLIARRLAPLGFRIEPLPFNEVTNLWARRGNQPPLLLRGPHRRGPTRTAGRLGLGPLSARDP